MNKKFVYQVGNNKKVQKVCWEFEAKMVLVIKIITEFSAQNQL